MDQATLDRLIELGACKHLINRASYHTTIHNWWNEVIKPDEMLWLLFRTGVDATLCLCECVRPVLACVPKGEERPRLAIEAVEAFARGDDGATIEAVRAAGWSSMAACHYSAGYSSCYTTADSLRCAAKAASLVAHTADYMYGLDDNQGNDYSQTAACFSRACVEETVRAISTDIWSQMCVIIRRHFPDVPFLGGAIT